MKEKRALSGSNFARDKEGEEVVLQSSGAKGMEGGGTHAWSALCELASQRPQVIGQVRAWICLEQALF